MQFRMPLLPGINDDDENLAHLAHFLTGMGVKALRLVPYHRHYLAKYEALARDALVPRLAPPTPGELESVVRRLTQGGLEVAIDGA